MLDQLKQKLKDHWEQNKWQIVGLILLAIPAIVCGLLQEWGIGFGVLVITLAVDIWLMIKKEPTITKWARKLLPSLGDKIVMITIFCLVATLVGWGPAYWLTLGTILGHISWVE